MHEAVAVDPDDRHPLRDRGRVQRCTARQLLPVPAEPAPRRPRQPAGRRRRCRPCTCPDSRTCRRCRRSARRSAASSGSTSPIPWPPPPRPGPRSTRSRSPAGRSSRVPGGARADHSAYFVSSFARPEDGSAGSHEGQVWRYDPRANDAHARADLHRCGRAPTTPYETPDNMCVSPYGGLMICEDSTGENYMIGTTADGEPFMFARNRQVTDAGRDRRARRCVVLPGRPDHVLQRLRPGYDVRRHRPLAPAVVTEFGGGCSWVDVPHPRMRP